MAASSSKRSGRTFDRSLLVIEAVVGIVVVSAIVGKAYGPAPTFVFLLCAAALAFTGYVVFQAAASVGDHTLELAGRIPDEQRKSLQHEKYLILQGIKELEADAGIGKVDPADYQHLRRSAEARAVEIIQTLERDEARWLEEAARLVEKRVGPIAGARVEGPAPVRDGGDDPTRWAQEGPDARAARTAYAGLFDHRLVRMPGGACRACDTPNEDDARYCVGCGRPVDSAPAGSTA